nr:MAG: hypothetical protein J07AB56_08050 [Candidatus Nanosalinarum sp. J07AB56]
MDAVAREMELAPDFDAYETSSKRNQGSVSFGIGGRDYDLVFVDATGQRFTKVTVREEGETYDGEPPSSSATPQEVVNYLQDALG